MNSLNDNKGKNGKFFESNWRNELIIYSRDWEIIQEEQELIAAAEEIKDNYLDIIPPWE